MGLWVGFFVVMTKILNLILHLFGIILQFIYIFEIKLVSFLSRHLKIYTNIFIAILHDVYNVYSAKIILVILKNSKMFVYK